MDYHSFGGKIRCLLGALLALALSNGAWAAGGCSPSIGKVTLNEYNYIDNFTEIKLLDTSVSLAGWKVAVYTAQRTSSRTLPSTGASSCYGGVYQTQTYASNEVGTTADVVLLDNNNDVVDILRVRTALPVTTTYYGPKPACSFVGATTDLLITSGSKGVDRMPDGNGDWRQTPGTGNNALQSPCGPNLAGGNADMAITKTVNSASVVQGTDVVFTITASNAGTGSATAVLVNDLLPSGLSYSTHTVTSGTYNASTGVWSIGTMAVGGSATLTLTATTTLAGTITNTATVASSTFDPNTANNSASVSVTVTSAGATLNAVEVGAASGTTIHTKLAGTGFSLDLLALDASGSIATSYNRTVTIELVDSASSTVCASRTLLQTVGTYKFTGSGGGKDNGRKTYAFNYPNAAPNVRVRLKDDSPTPITACSTDNFAVRPVALTVSSSNANADAAGASTTAAPAIRAGANFSLTATAVDGASPVTTLTAYAGTPVVDSALLQAHTGAAVTGTVSGSFSAAVAGVASGSTFSYSEVGYFQAASTGVRDDTFTIVDQGNGGCTNDFSNTLVGGKYGCKFGNVAATSYFGRFIPDHFDTVVTQGCSAVGGFTYSGQPFSVQVTARNGAGATTQNYRGSPAPSFSRATTLSDAGAAANFSNNTIAALDYAAGVATNTTVAYTFPNPQTAPANITLRAIDADNVSSSGYTEGTAGIRGGRLRMANAYGSELLALPVALEAQYWTSGGYYTRNTDDSCTVIPMSGIVMGNYLGALTACKTQITPTTNQTLSAGRLPGNGLVLTKPGAGNSGSVDLTLNTGSTASGQTCLSAAQTGATAGNIPWLGPDPTARATFGVYRSRLIYSRENY